MSHISIPFFYDHFSSSIGFPPLFWLWWKIWVFPWVSWESCILRFSTFQESWHSTRLIFPSSFEERVHFAGTVQRRTHKIREAFRGRSRWRCPLHLRKWMKLRQFWKDLINVVLIICSWCTFHRENSDSSWQSVAYVFIRLGMLQGEEGRYVRSLFRPKRRRIS